MDSLDGFMKSQAPTPLRPLLGRPLLAVEDSRLACEALRLVCIRSGARIRRADSLSSARRHLQVYRPTVVLIDMGLPDGSGAELLADLAQATPRVSVILGMSGDDTQAEAAREAGADGFLAKPISSLAAFQAAVLAHLPRDRQPLGPRPLLEDEIQPDRIAFHDDIAHAQEALAAGEAAYAAQFLESLAQCSADSALRDQAVRLSWAPDNADEIARTQALLEDRLGTRLAV